MTDRTALDPTDGRRRRFEQASGTVVADDHDDPPRSDVIDPATTHPVESEEHIRAAREGSVEPTTSQRFDSSVLCLRYRTRVVSSWGERDSRMAVGIRSCRASVPVVVTRPAA
ncbi:DUF7386 family protein [Haloglomus irregulare]|jgi:hypothetical protein|uniref:DUF7386 family protein n=1 Tax=Haloglomus irregulare TaxID=2234134 RepID=UPI001EE39C94|nr:hypothetical protein [Haloglomus irregulare]